MPCPKNAAGCSFFLSTTDAFLGNPKSTKPLLAKIDRFFWGVRLIATWKETIPIKATADPPMSSPRRANSPSGSLKVKSRKGRHAQTLHESHQSFTRDPFDYFFRHALPYRSSSRFFNTPKRSGVVRTVIRKACSIVKWWKLLARG